MRYIIKNNSIFLGLCLIFIIILGVVLLLVPKADLHLWLNPSHTAAADVFFRGYTVIAEWVPYVLVVLLLCYRAGWSVFLLTDLVLAGHDHSYMRRNHFVVLNTAAKPKPQRTFLPLRPHDHVLRPFLHSLYDLDGEF